MLGPIKDVKTTDRIVAALKAHIVGGNLASGTEIPSEKDLAQQLGVSKFSLREALRIAETQGLIEISRGSRAKVAEPSAFAAAEVIALSLRRSSNTLVDLSDARHLLETHIARVAAMKATAIGIRALEATVQALASNEGDLDLCVEQDLEFHNLLARATGNPVFEIMLSPLTELLRESMKQTISYDIQGVVSEHKGIIEALKSKNPEQAAKRMSLHLDLALHRQLKTKVAAVRTKKQQ